MLQIAPSGYRRHAELQREPHRRCARAQRDAALVPIGDIPPAQAEANYYRYRASQDAEVVA